MSLLVKRAKILGGAEKYDDVRDVFVHRDKISAIGDFPNKGADIVIDARGAYLSPGFIDINTDSDHYLTLFDHPSQNDFIKQGVTTIIGGMCGSSLAPLIYGSLESIQKWGDTSRVNVNWRTVNEFLLTLDQKRLAVNFGTLVGHSTIRRALIGENIRDLTKNELQVFAKTLGQALEEGSFGLSTGLSYAHSLKTPYSEIKFLNEVVKKKDGVYATHLRNNTAELASSIDETIRLAREIGVRTVVSHFMPIMGTEDTYEAMLEKIESLPKSVRLKFDVYPSDTSMLAIYTFLPTWAQNGGRETMLANLKDEWFRTRIAKDMARIEPEHFIVAQAPRNEFLIGKTLKEIAARYGTQSYGNALIELMIATELKAIAHYKNINASLIKKAIKNPLSFIASNAASSGSGNILKSERVTSTFTRFIELIESEKVMGLEEAIKKITLEPAQYFGLDGRGEIKEGASADLAMFQISNGMREGEKRVEMQAVIVNGEIALKDGVCTEKRAGKNMRHKNPLA